MTFNEMERQYWTTHVVEAKGNVHLLSRLTGCSINTVYRRLDRFDLMPAIIADRLKPGMVAGIVLTPREIQVFELLHTGLQDKEILPMIRPEIGLTCFRKHVRNMYKKLGVKGRRGVKGRQRLMDRIKELKEMR